jgi:hypothetical protein
MGRDGMLDEKKLCGRVGRLEIVQRPIAELKLDQTNPRLHSPRQVKQLARSMEAFRFNVPVLIDRNRKGDRRAWTDTGRPAVAASVPWPDLRV